MLGSSLAFALVEGTPAGKALKNEVVGVYKELNQKLKNGSYMYGNPVQLTRFSSQLRTFRKGDPLSPFDDDEKSMSFSTTVGSYVQESRALYAIAKRRVRSVISEDGVIETLIRWYAAGSFTVAVKYDEGDPASKQYARLLSLFPLRADLLLSLGLVFTTYKEEAKVIPPVFSNPAASLRITGKIKSFLLSGYADDVELRKIRLSYDDQTYIHPVFYVKPSQEKMESLETMGTTFVGVTNAANLSRYPGIKKLVNSLSKIATYYDDLVGSDSSKLGKEDQEEIEQIRAKLPLGREMEIEESKGGSEEEPDDSAHDESDTE